MPKEIKEKIIEILNKNYLDHNWHGFSCKTCLEGVDELSELFSQQRKEILEEIENLIAIFKILKLACKEGDIIEKKEAHDIFIEKLEVFKQKFKGRE